MASDVWIAMARMYRVLLIVNFIAGTCCQMYSPSAVYRDLSTQISQYHQSQRHTAPRQTQTYHWGGRTDSSPWTHDSPGSVKAISRALKDLWHTIDEQSPWPQGTTANTWQAAPPGQMQYTQQKSQWPSSSPVIRQLGTSHSLQQGDERMKALLSRKAAPVEPTSWRLPTSTPGVQSTVQDAITFPWQRLSASQSSPWQPSLPPSNVPSSQGLQSAQSSPWQQSTRSPWKQYSQPKTTYERSPNPASKTYDSVHSSWPKTAPSYSVQPLAWDTGYDTTDMSNNMDTDIESSYQDEISTLLFDLNNMSSPSLHPWSLSDNRRTNMAYHGEHSGVHKYLLNEKVQNHVSSQQPTASGVSSQQGHLYAPSPEDFGDQIFQQVFGGSIPPSGQYQPKVSFPRINGEQNQIRRLSQSEYQQQQSSQKPPLNELTIQSKHRSGSVVHQTLTQNRALPSLGSGRQLLYVPEKDNTQTISRKTDTAGWHDDMHGYSDVLNSFAHHYPQTSELVDQVSHETDDNGYPGPHELAKLLESSSEAEDFLRYVLEEEKKKRPSKSPSAIDEIYQPSSELLARIDGDLSARDFLENGMELRVKNPRASPHSVRRNAKVKSLYHTRGKGRIIKPRPTMKQVYKRRRPHEPIRKHQVKAEHSKNPAGENIAAKRDHSFHHASQIQRSVQPIRPAFPGVRSQEARPAAPVVRSQEARPPAPVVRSQEARPAAPVVRSQEARPAAPVVRSQDARPTAPVVQNQEARPAAPVVRSQEARPPAPVIQRQEARPPAPFVRSQEARPAAPFVRSQEARSVVPVPGQRSPQQPLHYAYTQTSRSRRRNYTVTGGSAVYSKSSRGGVFTEYGKSNVRVKFVKVPVYIRERIYIQTQPRVNKKKEKTISDMKGFYIDGGVQYKHKVSGLDGCRQACERTPFCFAGDFNTQDGTCFFHTHRSACGVLRAHPQRVHFKKVPCSLPEIAAVDGQAELNLGKQFFRGIEHSYVHSFQDCVKKCSTAGLGVTASFEDRSCLGLDYDFSSHRCFIFGRMEHICDDATAKMAENPNVVNIRFCQP